MLGQKLEKMKRNKSSKITNTRSLTGGGGGRTDAQSQYGGTTGYDSSSNQSGREQSYGGGNDGGSFDYESEAYGTTTPTTPTPHINYQ